MGALFCSTRASKQKSSSDKLLNIHTSFYAFIIQMPVRLFLSVYLLMYVEMHHTQHQFQAAYELVFLIVCFPYCVLDSEGSMRTFSHLLPLVYFAIRIGRESIFMVDLHCHSICKYAKVRRRVEGKKFVLISFVTCIYFYSYPYARSSRVMFLGTSAYNDEKSHKNQYANGDNQMFCDRRNMINILGK